MGPPGRLADPCRNAVRPTKRLLWEAEVLQPAAGGGKHLPGPDTPAGARAGTRAARQGCSGPPVRAAVLSG